MKKLTPKQERFCLEVAKGKTYSEAYRIAYTVTSDKPERTWVHACELAKVEKVQGRIKALQERLVSRCLMSKQQWLERLDMMCRADVRKIFNAQGHVKEIHELADEEVSIIAGIEVEENFAKVGDKVEHVGYIKKIKLVTPDKTHMNYGKARGWLNEGEQKPVEDNSVTINYFTMTQEEHEQLDTHSVIDITPSDGARDDSGGRGGDRTLDE